MKPNFALSLSFEGIRLLHRAAGGWRLVGDVALDAEDMTAELAILRKTASALEPGGVRTKLLIPNDQIKFMTIDTAGLSDAERMRESRAILAGATPYEVDDLAYDISSEGDKTHIAAVARETLAEAEAFAIEHRFHPVSFVARPETGAFVGEPFFGQTQIAATLLEGDDQVEPDRDAVTILGPYVPPAPSVLAEAEAEMHDHASVDDASQGAEPDTQPDEATQDGLAFDAGMDELPLTQAAPVDDQTNETGPSQGAPENPSDGELDDSPDISSDELAAAISTLPHSVAKAPTPDPQIAATQGTAPAAFASRRTGTPIAPAKPSPSIPVAPQATAPIPAAAMPVAPLPDSRSLTAISASKSKRPKLGFLSKLKSYKKTSPAAAPYVGAVAGNAGSVRLTKAASEAEQMTIFGARKSNNIGGKPRFLGLLLTAALLIFLAGVAAWASVFMDDGMSLSRLFGGRDTTAIASAPAAAPAPDAQDATLPSRASLLSELPLDAPPLKSPNSDLGERVAALDPSLTDEDGAVLDALRIPQLAQPRVMTQQEIEAKYAMTGIWALAPLTPTAPGIVSLDDLYMTSIDPVSTANDAIALPTLASFGGDSFDFRPSLPAAPGTSFTLNDNGLVIPTPEGAVNPDGIKVIAGRPPVEPPQALSRAAIAPQADETQSALSGFRPVIRPADLVESNERSNLDGLTRSELASLRPELRPASIQQLAAATAPSPEVTAATAAAGASLAVLQPTVPARPASAINNATRLAVQASVRPDPRPNNFASIVKRAERIEVAPTQVASAAAVAPRVVAPTLPSKTSVAKQATVKNAIKLRDINLIGVYGKPSSRRALIRLSNGRYQKVAVGDKLDGGRVSAIGEGELRYTRRGRDVVLKMPRG